MYHMLAVTTATAEDMLHRELSPPTIEALPRHVYADQERLNDILADKANKITRVEAGIYSVQHANKQLIP
jgi:hypothetical protein